jgi:hypothetical protein
LHIYNIQYADHLEMEKEAARMEAAVADADRRRRQAL